MAETNETAAATDVLKPYTGPAASPNTFAKAYPEMEQRAFSDLTRKGVALHPETQQNLDEFKRAVRGNPPKPATIINLLPFELQISHLKWTRGIRVPACPPGQEFAHIQVRGWMYDSQYVDGSDGVRKFALVRPIDRAAEFIRLFNDKEMWGSGVVIYEGEGHPDKAGEVETYDTEGRVITNTEKRWEVDDDTGQRSAIEVPIPIRQPLRTLLEKAIERRNGHFLRKVQEADHDYRMPDKKGLKRDFEIPRLMAEVLMAEGLISELPVWNLATRLEKGQAEHNCPSCGEPHSAQGFKCKCGHILDAFHAYMEKQIEYGHVAMEGLSAEQWVLVEDERERREAARAQAKAMREKAAKKAAKKGASTETVTE